MPNLTIYLIREDFKTPAEAIEGLAAEFPVIDEGEQLGTLYVKEMPEHPPKWTSLFSDFTTGLTALTRSTAALYLTTVSGRIFAIAFGHGRHLLKAGAVEDGFGLRVVINALKADQLRSIDKRTFDTVDQNIRSQVSQQSAAAEFGIDIERDLIRGITGIPADGSLGSRLSGSDSLVVSVEVDIPTLPELLERYLEAYQSEDYKEHFAWVDQIKQVAKNTALEATLEEKLVARMKEAQANGGHAPGLWLAIPEIVDYDGIHRFRFTGSSGSHNDLHLPGFFESLKPHDDISSALLKQKQAFAVNEDGYPVGQKWTVHKCIHFEAELDDSTYLLAAGKWFRIQKDFATEINDFYEEIPRINLGWMEYTHESEGAFNMAVHEAAAGKYALMDAVPIAVGGVRDKIEFCDLYSASKELIHVKRYGSSSVLGHLFNQGLVCGELLRGDSAFPNKVDVKIVESHRLGLSEDVPRDIKQFAVVFVIISEDQSDKLSIPFFAKVALKHVVTRLRSLGYEQIFLSKVRVADQFSKAIKLKSAAKKKAKKAAVMPNPTPPAEQQAPPQKSLWKSKSV